MNNIIVNPILPPKYGYVEVINENNEHVYKELEEHKKQKELELKIIPDIRSYIGNGLYGESNPNIIIFENIPKLVQFIKIKKLDNNNVKDNLNDSLNNNTSEIINNSFIIVDLLNSNYQSNIFSFINGKDSNNIFAKIDENNNKIYWYSNNAYEQFNEIGWEYYYQYWY